MTSSEAPPQLPRHSFPDDDATQAPVNLWRSNAHLPFWNWIVGVYAETPFNVNAIAAPPALQGRTTTARSATRAGFNRTTASLITPCLLLVPLIALTMGAVATSGERDRATFATRSRSPSRRHSCSWRNTRG